MLVAEVEPFIRRCCLIALKFGSRGAMCWRKVIRSSKRRKSGSDFACWHFLDVWNHCTCFSFVFVQVFLILWGMHWVRRRRDLNSWPRLWVSDMQALWDLLVFARTRGFLEQRTFYDARVCSTLHVASSLSFCKCRRRWSRWRRSHTGLWQHVQLESVHASPGQLTSRDVAGVAAVQDWFSAVGHALTDGSGRNIHFWTQT